MGQPDVVRSRWGALRVVLRRPRRRRRLLVGGAAVIVALAVGPWALVQTGSAAYRDPSPIPKVAVALVLGAGLAPGGGPSPFLAERVSTAVRLYQQGTVKVLLMSGDNSFPNYDEPAVMRTAAIAQGVPASAVIVDDAGFDTYSSCYRARSVWGLISTIVVTQPFHLPRAVWLCRALGVNAIGVGTVADDVDATSIGRIREIPAAALAVWEVVIHRTPIFAGPREHTLDAVIAAG